MCVAYALRSREERPSTPAALSVRHIRRVSGANCLAASWVGVAAFGATRLPYANMPKLKTVSRYTQRNARARALGEEGSWEHRCRRVRVRVTD